jgi:AcrR family transcriptional regulator
VKTEEQRPEQVEESETRDRVLAEAERIFAANGYDGTSVRRITEAAGANVAAVSYYFGGKEGLYQAVFERFFDEMRQRRIRRVEADLEVAGDEVSLEYFLESFSAAFVEPLVEGERGRNFISLFDQEMRLGKVPQEAFFLQLLEPMLNLFLTSLKRTGVELTRKVAALCLMSLVGQLTHALKVSSRFGEGAGESPMPMTLDAMIPHIVRFSAAGIRACAAEYDRQET